MRAQEFIVEFGDKPFPMKKRWSYDGYDQFQKTAVLPNNNHLDITINLFGSFALVNFYVNGSQQLTNTGGSVEIFSTVLAQMQDFVRKKKPQIVAFTGNYDDPSRIRLYDRIAQRLETLPAFRGYKNITNREDLWPEHLQYGMDDIQDISGQKTYVIASPQYLRSL